MAETLPEHPLDKTFHCKPSSGRRHRRDNYHAPAGSDNPLPFLTQRGSFSPHLTAFDLPALTGRQEERHFTQAHLHELRRAFSTVKKFFLCHCYLICPVLRGESFPTFLPGGAFLGAIVGRPFLCERDFPNGWSTAFCALPATRGYNLFLALCFQ